MAYYLETIASPKHGFAIVSLIAAKANTQQYVQTGYKYDGGDIWLMTYDNSNQSDVVGSYAFPNETRLWYIDPMHTHNIGFPNGKGVKNMWLEKKETGERYYLIKDRTCVNGAYYDPDVINGVYNGYTDPVDGRNIFQRVLWEGNGYGYLKVHVEMDLSAEYMPVGVMMGYKQKVLVYGWVNR